jgi:hypothetical protein
LPVSVVWSLTAIRKNLLRRARPKNEEAAGGEAVFAAPASLSSFVKGVFEVPKV